MSNINKFKGKEWIVKDVVGFTILIIQGIISKVVESGEIIIISNLLCSILAISFFASSFKSFKSTINLNDGNPKVIKFRLILISTVIIMGITLAIILQFII